MRSPHPISKLKKMVAVGVFFSVIATPNVGILDVEVFPTQSSALSPPRSQLNEPSHADPFFEAFRIWEEQGRAGLIQYVQDNPNVHGLSAVTPVTMTLLHDSSIGNRMEALNTIQEILREWPQLESQFVVKVSELGPWIRDFCQALLDRLESAENLSDGRPLLREYQGENDPIWRISMIPEPRFEADIGGMVGHTIWHESTQDLFNRMSHPVATRTQSREDEDQGLSPTSGIGRGRGQTEPVETLTREAISPLEGFDLGQALQQLSSDSQYEYYQASRWLVRWFKENPENRWPVVESWIRDANITKEERGRLLAVSGIVQGTAQPLEIIQQSEQGQPTKDLVIRFAAVDVLNHLGETSGLPLLRDILDEAKQARETASGAEKTQRIRLSRFTSEAIRSIEIANRVTGPTNGASADHLSLQAPEQQEQLDQPTTQRPGRGRRGGGGGTGPRSPYFRPRADGLIDPFIAGGAPSPIEEAL